MRAAQWSNATIQFVIGEIYSGQVGNIDQLVREITFKRVVVKHKLLKDFEESERGRDAFGKAVVCQVQDS